MKNFYMLQQFPPKLTAHAYVEQYPERHQHNETYFRFLVTNLLAYSSFVKPKSKTYFKNNDERNARIIKNIRNKPATSVRKIEEQTIPKSTAHLVLKTNPYHPYKPRIVQGLRKNDFIRIKRTTFCEWFINKCGNIPNFQSKVFWIDETSFKNCGLFH